MVISVNADNHAIISHGRMSVQNVVGVVTTTVSNLDRSRKI